MGSYVSKALMPLRSLVQAAQARADAAHTLAGKGVSDAAAAKDVADLGVGKADAARGVADDALPKAGGALTGTLTTIREIILNRTDADAILRFNKGSSSHYLIRRKHSNNVLEFFGYSASARLFQFAFGGTGLAAQIDQAGTSAPDAKTVMTREKGDARFPRRYSSGELTPVSGGKFSLAHGLGKVPRHVGFKLRCVSAEHGFSVGHEILISESQSTNQSNRIQSVRVTSSRIYITLSLAPNCFLTSRQSDGVVVGLTSSKWRFTVEALA